MSGLEGGRQRSGNIVIEAALVLPILLMLAFGTVEFGHFFYIKQTVQGAARAGARAAITPGATKADVSSAVAAVMSASGLDNYAVTTTPTDVGSVSAGGDVTVTVECNWGTVGVRPLGMISPGKMVRASAVMRREG